MFSSLKGRLQRAFGNSGHPTERYVGPLHKHLTSGDYSLSGFAPLIEGRFIEVDDSLRDVNQSGEITLTTISLVVLKAGCALAAMVFAEKDESSEEELKLTRLYPLKLLKFGMDVSTWTLKVEVNQKKAFFYKLLVPMEADPDYVSRWLRIISLLDDS